jgi:hypothetical protein
MKPKVMGVSVAVVVLLVAAYARLRKVPVVAAPGGAAPEENTGPG